MLKLGAWLRMMNVTGDYPVPMSDVSYYAHGEQADYIFPANGGNVQNDGTVMQEDWKLNHDFAQTLKDTAHAAGQLYIPQVGNSPMLDVLDSPELQELAANNIVYLALTRFDAPWDGVMLDIEGIPSDYKDKLSQFLYLLSYKIRKEKLLFFVSVHGIVSDPGPDYDDAYSYDFKVLSQVADYVEIRVHGYWNPTLGVLRNRSMSPYWYVKECIEYALSQGIPAQRLLLGIGVYTRYYPISSENAKNEICYSQALELVEQFNTVVEWIEYVDGLGLIRERFSDTGDGHLWILDYATLRHHLDLVDIYGLYGATLFILGMEDPRVWNVIRKWKLVSSRVQRYLTPMVFEVRRRSDFWCFEDGTVIMWGDK